MDSYDIFDDFNKIAKTSDFKFSSRNEGIQWSRIRSMNIDEVVKYHRISGLSECIRNILNCNLEMEFASNGNIRTIDPLLVKLFKISQLGIEFLLHCKNYLQKEINKLKNECRIKDMDLKHVKQKIRQQRIKEINEQSSAKCNMCGKVFLNHFYLNLHQERRHSSKINEVIGFHNNEAKHSMKLQMKNSLGNSLKSQEMYWKGKLKEIQLTHANQLNSLHDMLKKAKDENIILNEMLKVQLKGTESEVRGDSRTKEGFEKNEVMKENSKMDVATQTEIRNSLEISVQTEETKKSVLLHENIKEEENKEVLENSKKYVEKESFDSERRKTTNCKIFENEFREIKKNSDNTFSEKNLFKFKNKNLQKENETFDLETIAPNWEMMENDEENLLRNSKEKLDHINKLNEMEISRWKSTLKKIFSDFDESLDCIDNNSCLEEEFSVLDFADDKENYYEKYSSLKSTQKYYSNKREIDGKLESQPKFGDSFIQNKMEMLTNEEKRRKILQTLNNKLKELDIDPTCCRLGEEILNQKLLIIKQIRSRKEKNLKNLNRLRETCIELLQNRFESRKNGKMENVQENENCENRKLGENMDFQNFQEDCNNSEIGVEFIEEFSLPKTREFSKSLESLNFKGNKLISSLKKSKGKTMKRVAFSDEYLDNIDLSQNTIISELNGYDDFFVNNDAINEHFKPIPKRRTKKLIYQQTTENETTLNE